MDKERLAILVEVMEEEENYYRQLRELSLKERDSLAAGKVEAIEKGRQSCQQQVEKARDVADRRQRLMDELGLSAQDGFLDESAVKGLDEEQASRLRSAGRELCAAADELFLENRRNLKLARRTLDYLSFSLEAHNDQGKQTTYNRQATKKKNAGAGMKLVDKRV